MWYINNCFVKKAVESAHQQESQFPVHSKVTIGHGDNSTTWRI